MDRKTISIWLLAVSVLVVGMIMLGGATRLTDSGLSITEWDVVSGSLPPLSDEAWHEAFDKYKQIPEYELVNKGMSLESFKFIFWWEWSHRFLGRLIGLAFFIPFAFFLIKGMIGRDLVLPLTGLFILGGLQGALGWYMVQSGLVDRVDVSQYRLAAHLSLAFILLGALFTQALRLQMSAGGDFPKERIDARIVVMAWIILSIVFIQIVLGAFVAGLDAGKIFNSWPLMDGSFVPQSYGFMSPFIVNFFENHAAVQFNHRLTAYILLASVFGFAIFVRRLKLGRTIEMMALLLAVTVFAQAVLGIVTLLAVVPLSLALLHQAGAVLTFLMAVYLLNLLVPVKTAHS